jgi:hypothetical protein
VSKEGGKAPELVGGADARVLHDDDLRVPPAATTNDRVEANATPPAHVSTTQGTPWLVTVPNVLQRKANQRVNADLLLIADVYPNESPKMVTLLPPAPAPLVGLMRTIDGAAITGKGLEKDEERGQLTIKVESLLLVGHVVIVALQREVRVRMRTVELQTNNTILIHFIQFVRCRFLDNTLTRLGHDGRQVHHDEVQRLVDHPARVERDVCLRADVDVLDVVHEAAAEGHEGRGAALRRAVVWSQAAQKTFEMSEMNTRWLKLTQHHEGTS